MSYKSNNWTFLGLDDTGRRSYMNQIEAGGQDWDLVADNLIANKTFPDTIEGYTVDKDSAEKVNLGINGMWIVVKAEVSPPFTFNTPWGRDGLKYGRRVYSARVDAKGGSWETAGQWIIDNHDIAIPKVIDSWSIQTDTAEMVNTSDGMYIRVRTDRPAIVLQAGLKRDGTRDGFRLYSGILGDIDRSHFTSDTQILDFVKSDVLPDVTDNWELNKGSATLNGDTVFVNTVNKASATAFIEAGTWERIDFEGSRAYTNEIKGLDSDDTSIGTDETKAYLLDRLLPETLEGNVVNKERSFVELKQPNNPLSPVWLIYAIVDVTDAYFENPWRVIDGGKKLSSRVYGLSLNSDWQAVVRRMAGDIGQYLLADDGKLYEVVPENLEIKDLAIAGIFVEIPIKQQDAPSPSPTPAPKPSPTPAPAPPPKPIPTPAPAPPPVNDDRNGIPLTFFKINVALIAILLAFDKSDEEDLQYIKGSLGVLAGYGLWSLL